jgi:polysaccharide export outer membrane protein
MRRRERGDRVTVLWAVLVIGAFLAGCASAPATVAVPIPPAELTEYAIQSSDTLALQFYYHPDHSQDSVLVGSDGRIMLPLLGPVMAAGLTPSQLAAQLEAMYSSNLRDPRISVAIKVVYQNLVWVGGEVKKPGFVRYRPGLTAVQALVAAGGPKDTAATENCLLLQRIGRQEYRSAKLDLARAIELGDTRSDWVLGPQDVLFVPMTAVAKGNVLVDQYFKKLIPIRFFDKLEKEFQSSGDESTDEQPAKKSSTSKQPSPTPPPTP